MKGQEKKHLFGDPRNIGRVILILSVLCILSIVAEWFVDKHIGHPLESLLGFYAAWGFLACVVLVVVAKAIRSIVMRGEGYYDD